MLRLSALGDLVLATAAFEALERQGFRVSLVTKEAFAPLLRGQPGVQEVFAFDKKKGEAVAREELFSWVAQRRFELVLDLQNSWRTWTWRRRLRSFAPVKALPKPRLRELLVLVLRLRRSMGFGAGGRALRFRNFALRAVGAKAEETAPRTRLAVTEADRAAVASLVPPGDFAVLLPGGAWLGKEWPYFTELARRLGAKVPVVVLGGPADNHCGAVAAAAQEGNPESRTLHGRTSLRESMAVLERARWVIGNDTGMIHVAEALGKNVAMIEGPTHPALGFSPYRAGSLALGLSLVCRPCSKSGRVCVRFGSRICLRGLSAADVAGRLRSGGYPC